MTVDPAVGAAAPVNPAALSPHLEGVYFANQVFNTGSGSRQLRVDGIVVGNAGVTLGRDLASVWPGEYFHFRPEMAVYSPREVLQRNETWEEVAP